MRRSLTSITALSAAMLLAGATLSRAESHPQPRFQPSSHHTSPPPASAPAPRTHSAPPPSRWDGRGDDHHGYGHGSGRPHGSWYVGWGVGGWGPGWWGPGWGPYWDPYWNPYWDRYPYGPSLGYTRVYPSSQEGYGALDIDLSPERAEVWVDGQRVGIADDYDGFPRYLWLPKGTYDVVFYLSGYKTLSRQYSIYPGLVIDVEDRLEPGEATPPDQLASQSHERRDERLQDDREQAARAEAWGQPVEAPPGAAGVPAGSLDARSEPGRVRLHVEPADASVYLDGRFLGSGRELVNLRAGLLVDAGSHTVQIVRPGYQPEQRQIDVGSGQELEVQIELQKAAP